MAVLQTTQLTLSPCRPSDRANFIDLELDPEVMRFLNGGYAVDPERIDPNATFLMPRETELYVWTARRTTSGAFVGWFCLWPESETLAELGYRLRRMDWGQGLASEGASALVDWGFGSGRYDTIVASTMAVNHASRRVLEKVGLNYARTAPSTGPIPFRAVSMAKSGTSCCAREGTPAIRRHRNPATRDRSRALPTMGRTPRPGPAAAGRASWCGASRGGGPGRRTAGRDAWCSDCPRSRNHAAARRGAR